VGNILGTSFAQTGFSWDPNISPNNESFAAAVRAVTTRLGLGTGGGGGGGTLSNPTNKVSTIATNGTSTAGMRSDGAPAIDQAMAPVWTGVHSFGTDIQFTDITTPSAPSNGTLKLASVASPAANISQLTVFDAFGASIMIGYENHMLVYNAGTATFTRGNLAYINGGHGNQPTIGYAQANDPSTMPAVGYAQYNIDPGSFGVIHVYGLVSGNTNAFSVGDRLFVSETTPGALTNTVPASGKISQEVGFVTVSAGGFGGKLIVGVQTEEHAVLQPEATLSTGDLFYASGTHSVNRLAIGTSTTQVLTVSAGIPAWGSVPGYAAFAFDSVFYSQAGGI